MKMKTRNTIGMTAHHHKPRTNAEEYIIQKMISPRLVSSCEAQPQGLNSDGCQNAGARGQDKTRSDERKQIGQHLQEENLEGIVPGEFRGLHEQGFAQ